MGETIETTSRAYSNIPIQKISFEELYRKFEVLGDVCSTKEWEETWQYYYEFTDDEFQIDTTETLEEMNLYDADKQVEEIIKCAKNFFYFCTKYFKIQHPMKGMIPFITYRYQRRVIQQYESHRFCILSKFRQGGLTTVSVAWALWRCLFKLDQKIMVMSKTDREAIAAGEVAKKAMEELPLWMKPQMSKSNDHERQFKDTGSVLWFYTPEAARGKSITVLIIDEAAFIQDMHKHWKSMYPVISTGGRCCVISTVNGLGNWYEEMYHEAQRSENAFKVIELDYWEHPEYNNPVWVRDTKANLGEKGWQQEVLRSFLGSGETYISSKIIGELDELTRDNRPARIAFEKWANAGEERSQTWEKGALWIWKEPVDGHEYIIGVDCAEGVGAEGDNSAFQIIDTTTLEQVAEFYSNTVPPHIYSQIINEIGYYYNTALVVVENMNQGTAVLSGLRHDLGYDNIYYDQKGKTETPGIKTGPTNRPMLLETIQNRLMNESIRINSKRFVTELKTFVFNPQTKKAEAQKGKHDDAIMSLALALYVRDAQMRGMPVGAGASESTMTIYKSEIYTEIKQEIMNGSLEDWMNKDQEEDEDYMYKDDSIIVPFDIKRKNDKLLKEFGW